MSGQAGGSQTSQGQASEFSQSYRNNKKEKKKSILSFLNCRNGLIFLSALGWACVVHSRYVTGDYCYGDPASAAYTAHKYVDEALDEDGDSTSEVTQAAETSLRIFLKSRGIDTQGWKKTITEQPPLPEPPNPKEKLFEPPTVRDFELDAVCESMPHDLTLADLFAEFLSSGSKVVRAGPTKDLTSIVLAKGSRVFFEVSVTLRNDFFVKHKCLFKTNSARVYKEDHKEAQKPSTLVYIFNGEDPGKDWEKVFRSSSKDCAIVFDQIVFVWCAYARDLASQDEMLKAQAQLDAEKARADAEKARADAKKDLLLETQAQINATRAQFNAEKARAETLAQELARIKEILAERGITL